MAGPARLDTDQTRIQLLEQPSHRRSAQCFADNDFAATIDAMDLDYVLGQIKTDRANFHVGWLPWLVVA